VHRRFGHAPHTLPVAHQALFAVIGLKPEQLQQVLGGRRIRCIRRLTFSSAFHRKRVDRGLSDLPVQRAHDRLALGVDSLGAFLLLILAGPLRALASAFLAAVRISAGAAWPCGQPAVGDVGINAPIRHALALLSLQLAPHLCHHVGRAPRCGRCVRSNGSRCSSIPAAGCSSDVPAITLEYAGPGRQLAVCRLDVSGLF